MEIRRLEREVAKLKTQIQRGIQDLACATPNNAGKISILVDAWRDELERRQHDLGVLRGIMPDFVTIARPMQRLALSCENWRRRPPDMVAAALSEIIERIVFTRPTKSRRNSRGTLYFRYGLGLMSASFNDGDFAPTGYHEAAAVVATLSNGTPVSTRQVKDEIGVSMANTYCRLMRGVSAGLLEIAGKGLWKLATAPEGVNGMPPARDRIRRALADRTQSPSAQKKSDRRRSRQCLSAPR